MLSCLKCCNDYKNVESQDEMPDVIHGIVEKIVDSSTIMVLHKINKTNYIHYYVKLSYINPFPEKKYTAMKALSELILNKEVVIQDYTNFNYNSMDAKVFYNEICVNNWLVYNKFGKKDITNSSEKIFLAK